MEIGAGTGIHAEYFLAHYAPRISRYLLTDLSPEMLEVAAQRTARFSDLTSFLVTPAEQLLTEEKFDGIFMSGAMHHFSDPYRALIGFKNHLTEIGLVVECEPIVSNVYNFFNALSTGKDWGQFHVTRATIRRYMRELGYEIVEDKVLHYNWRSPFMAALLPNRKLEQIALLDSQAVMFLLAGKVN
jgi:SAM-dependent methyltransferase